MTSQDISFSLFFKNIKWEGIVFNPPLLTDILDLIVLRDNIESQESIETANVYYSLKKNLDIKPVDLAVPVQEVKDLQRDKDNLPIIIGGDKIKEEINEYVVEYELPLRPYINLKLTEQIMKLQEKEQAIQEIFELIGEGELRLKSNTQKSIILLGRTGAGKSTIVYDFGNKLLHAFRDDSTGNMLIDSSDRIPGINISHRAESETRIPGRLEVGGRTIWDMPGFNDTSIKQEVANAFYLKRACMNSNELTFVLVMSEAAITQDKGINAIEIMNQTIRLFGDLNVLDGAISLIITQTTPGKNSVHLKNNLQKVIEENPIAVHDAQIKQLFGYLSKSIHVFHIPYTEGAISNTGLLQSIEEHTQYKVSTPELVKVAISERSMPYVAGLLSAAENSFLQIVSLTLDAIKDVGSSVKEHPANIFLTSHEIVERWLPKSFASITYQNKCKLSKDDCLVELDQLSELIKVLPEQHNMGNIKTSIVSVLNILEFYSPSEIVKKHIQKCIHVFEQQIEYLKFLSEACADVPTVYSAVFTMMKDAQGFLQEQLKQQLLSLKIIDTSDIAYYNKTIKYLNIHSTEPVCIKTQAFAYNQLGNIYVAMGAPYKALVSFSKALQLDKTLIETYKRVGDLLLQTTPPNYIEAIKYFKAVDDMYRVKTCFKKLDEQNPTDPKLKAIIGDYYAQIGLHDIALKYYNYAMGLSNDVLFKTEITNKRIGLLQNHMNLINGLAENLTKQVQTGDFYKYDEVKMADLVMLENVSVEMGGDIIHTD